MEMIETDLIF